MKIHKGLAWAIIFLALTGAIYFFNSARVLLDQSSAQLESIVQKNMERLSENISVFRTEPATYTLAFVGDIMMDRGVRMQVQSVFHNDYKKIFEQSAEILRSYDMLFGNLEGSISDVGADTGKKYSFRFSPESVFGLQDAGFDVVSLANNHIFDWGHDSLCATMGHLETVNIFGVGAGCDRNQAEQSYRKTLPDGTTIAIIAFTEFYKGGYATDTRPGLARYDHEHMIQTVHNLKEQGVNIIIVSLHWGIEYKTISENWQQTLAHDLIDAGADIIAGHHPHVVQQVERYGDGIIFYSLGNFVFDQKFSEETMKGMLAEVSVQKGEIVDYTTRQVLLNKYYQPQVILENTDVKFTQN